MSVKGLGGGKQQPTGLHGSISVFFALILLLVLSLVLVSIESARISVLQAMVSMNLHGAMEAELGNYHSALYEQYGILGLMDEQLEEHLLQYLQGAAAPTEDLPAGLLKGKTAGFSPDYTISKLDLVNPVSLLDGEGEIIRKQMLEEGILDGVDVLTEELLSALGIIQGAKKTTELLQEKLEVELQISQMEETLHKLIGFVDGARLSGGSFVVDKNGNLQTEQRFVKRLVPGDVTEETVRILHQGIYQALMHKLKNGPALIWQLYELAGQDGEEAYAQLLQCEVELGLLLRSCKEACGYAKGALMELVWYQQKLAPQLDRLEDLCAISRALIAPAQYEELMRQLEGCRKVLGEGDGSGGYDFARMLAVIKQNESCLALMQEKYVAVASCNRDVYRNELMWLLDALQDYSFDALEFDYSAIRTTVVEVDAKGFAALLEFFQNGVDYYLFDDYASLSGRAIYGSELPSKGIAMKKEALYQMPELDMEALQAGEGLEAYLTIPALDGVERLLTEAGDAIIEHLLLTVYAHRHFPDYSDQQTRGVVQYQKEYLVNGSMRDRDNVRGCALRILGIRVAMNLIFVLTDGPLNLEAEAYAASLSMGVPLVMAILKYLLLIQCGIQNALMETIAILKGKSVPLLVTTSGFLMPVGASMAFTRSMLHAMAEEYEGQGKLGMGYQHYMLLFVLLVPEKTLVYRSMDLMQENIRLYDDPDFYLKDCLHSFGVQLAVQSRTKYAGIAIGGDSPGLGSIRIRAKSAIGYR